MKILHEYVNEIKAEEAGPANGAAPAADWSRTLSSKKALRAARAHISREDTVLCIALISAVQAGAATFPGLWALRAPERVSVEKTLALCP